MEKGCRNCIWLYHMVTHNQTAPCSECLDYDKWQTAKPTNADRIRAMTDEELAEFCSKIGCYPSASKETCIGVSQCTACWLEWLKKEVE